MKTTISNVLASLIALFILVAIIPNQAKAQDSTKVEQKAEKKPEKPVRSPWNAGMLIETQTDLVWAPKTLEMVIQHRFGNLGSGSFDLAGLYAPSNIRIAVNYGLFKNAQIGVGTTKDKMIQDLNWKYKFLTQTRSNSMPIALTYYGNVEVNASESSSFGTGDNFSFANRVSFFNQLIISRKFSKKLTAQVTLNYSHFNLIDTNVTGSGNLKHDNFGFGVAGRYKLSSSASLMLEYDQALTTPENVKPNLSVGVEMATSGHAFQIFVTTYKGISYQNNMVYNQNDFTSFDKDAWGILIGFNITRNWNL
tara:strand:- start:11274 stop:12197 length:924 start_codon:yes stop_codon:yes gene_type:complete